MPADEPSAQPEKEKATVFVSDPSVEAERVSQALRAAEFHVVDVPLSMLVARVAVQRPRVVILDADAEGALDAVARMRELPDADGIDVLFCGRAGAVMATAEDALAHEGSGFFPRPVNVPQLVKKIESLVMGEPEREVSAVPSEPPKRISQLPPSGSPVTTQRSTPPSKPPSIPPPSFRPPPSQRAPQSAVSAELAQLLTRAEQRLMSDPSPSDAPPPSPEEELQAVLPEEVLAALDAPLDDEADEEEAEHPPRVTTSGGQAKTGERTNVPLTSDGSPLAHQTQGEPIASPTTGAVVRGTEEVTSAHRVSRSQPPPFGVIDSSATGTQPRFDATAALTTPPRRGPSSSRPPSLGLPSALSSTLGSELLIQQGGMLASPPLMPFGVPAASAPVASVEPLSPAPSTYEAPPPMAAQQSARSASAPRAAGPFALGPEDAPRVLAQSIAGRQTGALTFETPGGVRRIVLREGDIVTAASGVDSESLLAFLGARGDLPRERVEALAGRLPPNGRHAGAALVAQGALGQDQLWPVLRAHAEYLMARALLVDTGTAFLEPDAPGRLKTEPSVFGGAPGAEIMVEVFRRVFDNEEAMRRCGGPASIVAEGPRPDLLRECGLVAAEIDAIQTSRGQQLEAIVSQYPQTDIASVLYALWLLGVVEMVRSVLDQRQQSDAAPDALDEDAVRDRIRARAQLVEDGDYFALLGIPHSATSYEVRRAYLDLRHSFEPTRILTPGLIDLAEDVRRIATVLEEAYEILGDNARRERYRRAIDELPKADVT